MKSPLLAVTRRPRDTTTIEFVKLDALPVTRRHTPRVVVYGARTRLPTLSLLREAQSVELGKRQNAHPARGRMGALDSEFV